MSDDSQILDSLTVEVRFHLVELGQDASTLAEHFDMLDRVAELKQSLVEKKLKIS